MSGSFVSERLDCAGKYSNSICGGCRCVILIGGEFLVFLVYLSLALGFGLGEFSGGWKLGEIWV